MKNGVLVVLGGIVIAIIAVAVVFAWPFDSAPEVAVEDIATTTEDVQTKPITQTKATVTMNESKQDPLTEIKSIVARMRVLHSGEMTPAQQTEADALQSRYRELIPVLDGLEKDGVTAGINLMAHGYDLVVTINGKRVTHFNGQNSASAWLYSPEHYMSELLMEDSKELIALKSGENTIRIEYTQTEPRENFTLTLFSYDPPFDILDISVSEAQGVIEKTFTLAQTLPEGAQTVVVKE